MVDRRLPSDGPRFNSRRANCRFPTVCRFVQAPIPAAFKWRKRRGFGFLTPSSIILSPSSLFVFAITFQVPIMDVTDFVAGSSPAVAAQLSVFFGSGLGHVSKLEMVNASPRLMMPMERPTAIKSYCKCHAQLIAGFARETESLCLFEFPHEFWKPLRLRCETMTWKLVAWLSKVVVDLQVDLHLPPLGVATVEFQYVSLSSSLR